jgi:hypothetical protein
VNGRRASAGVDGKAFVELWEVVFRSLCDCGLKASCKLKPLYSETTTNTDLDVDGTTRSHPGSNLVNSKADKGEEWKNRDGQDDDGETEACGGVGVRGHFSCDSSGAGLRSEYRARMESTDLYTSRSC